MTSNSELEERIHTIFALGIILLIGLIFVFAFAIDSNIKINNIQNTIQNKTLEPNQTLAYGLGYSNGYYQCVEEVQQLQEEGKL